MFLDLLFYLSQYLKFYAERELHRGKYTVYRYYIYSLAIRQSLVSV